MRCSGDIEDEVGDDEAEELSRQRRPGARRGLALVRRHRYTYVLGSRIAEICCCCAPRLVVSEVDNGAGVGCRCRCRLKGREGL